MADQPTGWADWWRMLVGLGDRLVGARHLAGLFSGWAAWTPDRRIEALRVLAGDGPLLVGPVAQLLLVELRATVYSRVSAAEALAGLGSPYADRAYQVLAGLLADRSRETAADLAIGNGDKDGGFQQLFTAKAIGTLGPAYRQPAADALASVIARYGNYIRQQAAEALGALGAAHRPAAARTLWELVGGQADATQHVRLLAALSFASWGPDSDPETVAALRRLAGDPGFFAKRVDAAVALAACGAEYRDEATGYLLDVIGRRGFFEANYLCSAVRAVLELQPAVRESVVQVLRVHLAGEVDATYGAAALALTELDGPYRAEAVPALVRVLADPGTRHCDRVEYARALSMLSVEHSGSVLDTIIAVILDPVGEDWTVSWACEQLTMLDPAVRVEGVRRLVAVADDPALDEQRRGFAREALAELRTPSL